MFMGRNDGVWTEMTNEPKCSFFCKVRCSCYIVKQILTCLGVLSKLLALRVETRLFAVGARYHETVL